MVHIGDWVWSEQHQQACRVIDIQQTWGVTSYRVWLPERDRVLSLRESELRTLVDAGRLGGDDISYVVAAARIADALAHDLLLAPIGASVTPLPHQVRTLSRAMAGDNVRFLLADEVGLGKTIEAGLIMRELKLRGLIRRVLVIAPRGIVTQWVAEMRTHFAEEFRLLVPGEFGSYRRFAREENLWRLYDQVVCTLDSVKPIDSRRGWSREQVASYNRERFDDLITAGWDLVIIDEAHRLGGSTDQVARYRLGQGLAEATPYLLLLSATPHQGKTDAFHRLIALLDPAAFPDVGSVTRERVRPYVIRTAKRLAVNAQGDPLFQPRQTRLVTVEWAAEHQRQQQLYDAVTEYVRAGYNQAIREKKSYIGFLMILMQRLVTSSTRAIRTTLERRLDVLRTPVEQLSLAAAIPAEEWADLDSQEQLDALLGIQLTALRNERSEVALLLQTAQQIEAAGPDAKAEALLDLIYTLQREEGDPDLKLLIFTEFVPTQEMLRDFLTERGFSVVCLNGSMDMAERQRVQAAFAREIRILVSTDAGGEGLNLQFCHVIVNYDIPWNPMRLEQRIGRVDRIGQRFTVRALNFLLGATVEHRIREVIEEKLALILEEFGVDKTSDVLDSTQAGQMFDDLYVDALLNPGTLGERADSVLRQVREQAGTAYNANSLLSADEVVDPTETRRLLEHPLPHWVERMTVSYLRARGGTAERRGQSWEICWPDGERTPEAVFSIQEAEQLPTALHLTFEEPRIRNIVGTLTPFAAGQPIPLLELRELPNTIQGFWSLWHIRIETASGRRQRTVPLFLHDDGRVFMPTARRIWDELLLHTIPPRGYLPPDGVADVWARVQQAAEEHTRPIYEELLRSWQAQRARSREKAEYTFAARHRAIEQIGLAPVRQHRLSLLDDEAETWHRQFATDAAVSPELVPLLLVRVEGGIDDAQLA